MLTFALIDRVKQLPLVRVRLCIVSAKVSRNPMNFYGLLITLVRQTNSCTHKIKIRLPYMKFV